jgi:hypothetical protein
VTEALTVPDSNKSVLKNNEQSAYELYVKSQKPPLAITTAVGLFELFLNGATCEEIHRLNPHLPFGAIIRARVEGEWDRRRNEAYAVALDGARERVQQTQLAAISFAADLLATAHKQFGDRFKRYLQTGEESVLGELKIETLKQYKDSIEMFLKLTGQDKKPEVPRSPDESPLAAELPPAQKALTPEQADELLKRVLNRKLD